MAVRKEQDQFYKFPQNEDVCNFGSQSYAIWNMPQLRQLFVSFNFALLVG